MRAKNDPLERNSLRFTEKIGSSVFKSGCKKTMAHPNNYAFNFVRDAPNKIWYVANCLPLFSPICLESPYQDQLWHEWDFDNSEIPQIFVQQSGQFTSRSVLAGAAPVFCVSTALDHTR